MRPDHPLRPRLEADLEEMRSVLASMERGDFITQSREGTHMVDTTQSWITYYRGKIALLEALLAHDD